MSWIAEAHREWHLVHGWDRTCPLDCGAGEVYEDEEPEEVLVPAPQPPAPPF